MLALSHVAKEFDLRPVLDDVNLSVEPGRKYALWAENGSGKTTLLQIMAGISKPTRGHVQWDGKPLSHKSRRHLGVVLEAGFLFGDLTAMENLYLYAKLYGCESPRHLADEWLDTIGLSYARDVPIREFSKGMKQRLSLARAMVHSPQLLLLDEPFDGLDVKSVQLFQDLLRQQLCHGTSVFLVTHQTQEVSSADRRLTLKYGRLAELP